MSHFITLIKREDGKAHFLKQSEKRLYEKLIMNMKPGDMIQLHIEVTNEIGKLSQLAKIHAGFRKLADHIGESPAEVKKAIKQEAGFCTGDECRSLGEMSQEQLESVWQTLISKGEFVGLNLR